MCIYFNNLKRSLWTLFHVPCKRFVKNRWTLSILTTRNLKWGQTTEQYSTHVTHRKLQKIKNDDNIFVTVDISAICCKSVITIFYVCCFRCVITSFTGVIIYLFAFIISLNKCRQHCLRRLSPPGMPCVFVDSKDSRPHAIRRVIPLGLPYDYWSTCIIVWLDVGLLHNACVLV